MSFCKFSSDYLIETFTLVDNLFINEYLPYATESQIKVYLYGLYLSTSPSERDSTLESFATILNLEIDEVIDIFTFWEDNGLLQIVSKAPLQVKYLSLKGAKQPPKKYKSEKYYDFNLQVQGLFPNRPLVQNEYLLLYEVIESFKLQTDACLMMVQYCIGLKGLAVRFSYITAVIRNWAAEGVRTVEDVENKLSEYEAQNENMRSVLKALGRKSGTADLEETQLLLKWNKNWGFDLDSIVFAAKQCKNKGGFKKLDSVLDEYYRMNIYSAAEMKEYVEHLERMKALAIKVNTAIGVYYESLDHEIEVYINPWLSDGFDDEAVLTIARYCFMASIRSLAGVDAYVKKFFKNGLLTTESINQYIENQIKSDNAIKSILEASGSTRAVTAQDRDYYKIWCADWGFTDEVILYAATLAENSRFPIPAINQVLADMKDKKIYTAEEAKRYRPKSGSSGGKKAGYTGREYTKEELKATFSNVDNFDDDDI